MPQFWTEDPSIGQALAGLAESFSGKNQVAMANTIEDIKQKRLLAAARANAATQAETMWNARAAPQAAPVTSAQDAWTTSAGTPGTENVPIMGRLKPLTPLGPAQAADTSATSQAQQQINQEFARVRAKNLADARLGYNVATSMGDVVGNAPKQEALTQLDLYGVPKTVEGQTRMQTQLTGQLPMLDLKGTTSNYSIQDSQGNTVGAGTTRDGRTDLNTLQAIQAPPGGRVLKTGDLPADQNPYKDTGAQLEALSKLNTKLTIGNQALDPNEQQRAGILLDTLYPGIRKEVKDDAGRTIAVTFNEKVAPAVLGPLIAHLNGAPAAAAAAPPVQTAPPTPTASPIAPSPTMGAGPGQRATVPDALAGIAAPGPAGAPAATAAAQPAPIVPAGTHATTSKPGDVQVLAQGSGDTQLKEIINHKIVVQAMDAGRAYEQLKMAAADNTPEAALHMVYMLAKIFDPGSQVKEGEAATVVNTSPAAEKWWGLYNKQINAKSPLSERAKASYLDEGYNAAKAHYDQAKILVDYGGERAKNLGLNPALVMPPLNAPQRVVRSAGGGNRNQLSDVDAIVGLGR